MNRTRIALGARSDAANATTRRRGYTAALVLALLTTVMMAPAAAQAQNATAYEVIVQQDGPVLEARFLYGIGLFGMSDPNTIAFGLDKDNDGLIDPGAVLIQMPGATSFSLLETAFADLAPALNALPIGLRVEDGDQIVAQLDFDAITAESDETDNTASSYPLSVDLTAASLTMGTDNMATLTYVVNSVAIVDDFDVGFYLDVNMDGLLDPGDTLVDTQTVSGAVGAGTASTDFSASYPASGQAIFARVDDGLIVDEADENNNVAMFIASDDVDLIAGLLAYDEINEEAILSYEVVAPVDVDPYVIRFFLDRNDSGALDAGDGPAVASVNGEVTPGMHVTPAQSIAPPLASGQFLFAWVDRQDTVVEVDESDASNVAAAQNTDALDLVATALTYDSNTQSATFSFWVNSPTMLPAFTIAFIPDTDGDGLLTLADGPAADILIHGGAPGSHVLVADFSSSPLASNQQAFAVIIPGVSIVEDDSTNNMATAINTTPTDLIAVSLAYDANTQEATLSYVVDAPIAVPAYDIEFALDTDGSMTPTIGDFVFPLVPGMTTPGAHTHVLDCSAMPADAGQYMFAWIDRLPTPNGLVTETDEVVNNSVATINTAETDLEAIALTYDANTQMASLAYAVNSPIPVVDNTIEFYLDANDNSALDAGDPVIDTVIGAVAPGGYTILGDFSSSAPAAGQMVFAMVESALLITEADENNNVQGATNTAPLDLVANLIGSLTYDANLQLATLTYEVVSPIDVPAYNIVFLLDTDDNFIPSFGDTIVADISGEQTPGLHTAMESFAANPAASGQAIFAMLDAPPPLLFGDVLEDNELNNFAITINTEITDLEVVSLTYDANLQEATLGYVVHSSIDVDPYMIQFYIDDNDNGVLDPADTPVDGMAGETAPGGHTATGIYMFNPPASGQKVFAVLDTSNAIIEDDETNNVGEARNWSPTDLVAISLAYDSNTEEAVLSYSVVSPIDVLDYQIRFFLDRNGSGILDLGDGPAVATMMGEVAPGSYATTPVSFTGDVPASGQFIFAAIDRVPWPNGVVVESDESYVSNIATTSNTQETNLVANSVSVFVDDVNNETTASVSYTIYSPIPVDPFSLKVGLDRDSNGVIDGGGSDVLADILVTNPIDLAPGSHVIDVPNFRPALNGLPLSARINHGDFIVATLDLNQDGSPAGAVTESEEWTDNSVDAMPTVDLVANALIIVTDPSAASTKARIAYTVDSPGAVEEFQILVGVDRDNDEMIDTLADVLLTIPVSGNKLRPGMREILSVNFRAELNAIMPKLQQQDRIIAIFDLNQDNTPVNDVEELDEHDNNIVKRAQRVDLVANAVSLNTDVLGGTTEAEVAYTVDSAGSAADFSLKIGLDRDGDGLIDDPDGLLSDQILTGADVTPGAHTVTVTGLRAALNGLATPIKNGDAIVATLDLILAGTDEGAVNEDIEKNNNSASQIQTVDLVANSIAVQSDDQTAMTSVSVSYLIVSPADAAPFDIMIGVDRDGDDVIDGDATDVLATMAAPDLTPGTHTLDIADIRPALEALLTRLAEGDRIIATLDLDQAGSPANEIVEAAEVDNNFAVQTQTVDLVATEASLFTTPGGNQKKVRVSYTVVSPGTVSTFNVRVGIDADNNGVLDPGSVLRIYDVETDIGVAGLQPGEHQITTDDLTADLNVLALENGARVIATLDLLDVDPYDVLAENLVAESEDLANNRARQPLDVDLLAISLAYDATTNIATLSYSVNSEVGVPAYDITFYLDDNKDGIFNPADDSLVDTKAGMTVPGAYTVEGDYNLTQVDTHQFIFAVLDIADVVNELNEGNNEAGTDNTEITDLIANGVTLVSDNILNETKAAIAYTIIAPEPFSVPAFDILVGVDRDGDDLIDSAADVLETIAAPDLTPGAHEATSGDLRPVLEALADRLDNGDRIIVMLDLTFDGIPVNNVEEIGGDETTNNVTGYAVLVDLIATDLDIFTVPATGELLGQVNYTIASPATVDAFNVLIGVDADDDKIIDPGSLLATIDLSTLAVDVLRPGEHMVETADLAAVLNALPTPLANGDRLIATVDLLEDGTPENLVGENEEIDNNIVRAMQMVDLVAQSIFLTIDNDAMTTAATVTYTINSIGYTADFNLRIGIDRDGDDIIDANPGDELFTTLLTGGDVLPGAHTFEVADIRPAINALSPTIEYGDRIVATLDLDLAGADEAAVVESNEVGNNVTSMAGTQAQIIDITADELNINVGSFIVTATYTVTGPGNVAPFDIDIGRDTDADDVIDDVLITIAGDPTPGTHQVQADVAAELLALGVASGELVNIVVDIDVTGAVAELSETNNKLLGSATYDVDLVLARLTHPCAMIDNAFDVEVEYQVLFNQPSEGFQICIYAAGDDADSLTPGDIRLVCMDITDPADMTVGDHTVIVPGALFTTTMAETAPFPPEHFFVKAVIDSLAVVNETEELNNWAARPNAAQDPSEDADGDGVPDCFDDCPADPNKVVPGSCGCGVSDNDADNDGVADCWDNCPDDPNKLDPGVCGCGVVDDLTDADNDGVFVCLDPDDNNAAVPNPQGVPGGQEVPGTDDFPFEVIIPIVPAFPMPVCGIGLCGSGAMVPMGIMLLGFVGMKTWTRRRNRR